jgi:hypothetical protein
VKEGGRLPLRRGPKALQLEGVPFYELTETGLLVASSIEEIGDNRMKMLERYIRSIPSVAQSDNIMREGILLLIRMAPSFASKIISEYIYAYSTGLIDKITPLDSKKLQSVISKQIMMERELIEAIIGLQPDQKELVRSFFKVIS